MFIEHPIITIIIITTFSLQVRCACVKFYSLLLINHGVHSKLCEETLPHFISRRHDTDETVRLAVVASIRHVAIHSLKYVSDELLVRLKERVKDKKVNCARVRACCVLSLLRLVVFWVFVAPFYFKRLSISRNHLRRNLREYFFYLFAVSCI